MICVPHFLCQAKFFKGVNKALQTVWDIDMLAAPSKTTKKKPG
jgi:hypothetical protein